MIFIIAKRWSKKYPQQFLPITWTLVKRKRLRSVASEANLADWKSINLTSEGIRSLLSCWSCSSADTGGLREYRNRMLDSQRSPWQMTANCWDQKIANADLWYTGTVFLIPGSLVGPFPSVWCESFWPARRTTRSGPRNQGCCGSIRPGWPWRGWWLSW